MPGAGTNANLQSSGNLTTLPAYADTLLCAGWIGYWGTVAVQNTLFSDDAFASFDVEISKDTPRFPGVAFWVIQGGTYAGPFNEPPYAAGAVFYCNGVPVPVVLDSSWISFAVSAQVSTSTLQLMVNLTLYDTTPYTFFYTNNPIAMYPFGGAPGTGALAPHLWSLGSTRNPPGVAYSDFRFGAGEPFFDLTIPANQNKLFAPGNHPVDWGYQGELVTGFSPAIFLHGSAAIYANNLGTGGPFTPFGSITDFTPIPS